jgi:hypothetical protein
MTPYGDSHDNDFVTKDILRLELALLSQQIDAVLKVSEACLEEQKKTNGTVREHTTTIAKIQAIGATAWMVVAAILGWDFWRRP